MSARRNAAFRKMKKPSTPREPTYDDLLAIVRLVEAGSRFSEFRLRSGDIEVEFKRGGDGGQGTARESTVFPSATPDTSSTPQATPSTPSPIPRPPSPASSPVARPPSSAPAGSHLVSSPMVGTFYRSPQPGAPPFVEIGSSVKRDTVVCIIEVMKLMSSITAGVEGEVVGIYAENAQAVEPGQVLMAVRAR